MLKLKEPKILQAWKDYIDIVQEEKLKEYHTNFNVGKSIVLT